VKKVRLDMVLSLEIHLPAFLEENSTMPHAGVWCKKRCTISAIGFG
jgi:hypothetical protein